MTAHGAYGKCSLHTLIKNSTFSKYNMLLLDECVREQKTDGGNIFMIIGLASSKEILLLFFIFMKIQHSFSSNNNVNRNDL